MSPLSIVLSNKESKVHQLLQHTITEHKNVTFANSLGCEDMVLTDIILRYKLNINIFSLDTGRLHQETLDVLEQIYTKYKYRVDVYYPDPTELESFVKTNGINAFYNSVAMRKKCCNIRKVTPLKRALTGYNTWITGLRQQQSASRESVLAKQWDANNNMHKISPLIEWSEKEIWEYINFYAVPYNKLHDQHYPSIGCAPCTRSITAGEDVRSGRWWWEEGNQECGLHETQK